MGKQLALDLSGDTFNADDIPAPGSAAPTATQPAADPDAFWSAWLARPHTPQTRLDDLVFQIKRDLAVLRQEPSHPDRAFYEARIAAYRADAKALTEELACTS